MWEISNIRVKRLKALKYKLEYKRCNLADLISYVGLSRRNKKAIEKNEWKPVAKWRTLQGTAGPP